MTMTTNPLETKTPALDLYQQIYKELKINPRTIQWYATEGYIPKPEKIGSEAYYSPEAQIAVRIRVIQLLQKKYSLKLKEIKQVTDAQANNDWEDVYNLLVALEEHFPYEELDNWGNERVSDRGSAIAQVVCNRLKDTPVIEISLPEIEEQYEIGLSKASDIDLVFAEGEIPF